MPSFVLGKSCRFADCLSIRQQGEKALQTAGEQKASTVIFDFSELKSFDSSLLTVILCWLRYGKALNLGLSFLGINEHLRCMMRVYGIDDFLTIE